MLSLLISIVLSPLLFIQGKWVRYKTPVLPEPEGSRAGVVGSGTPLKLWVIGDSAAAGVGAASQDQALLGQLQQRLLDHYELDYQLHALTGDNSQQCIEQLASLPAQKVDVVVTSLGVNDLTSGCTLQAFEARQKRLLGLLSQRFNADYVVLSGMPPVGHFPALPQPLRWCLGSRAQLFDAVVKRVARESKSVDAEYLGLDFADDVDFMASDGFHPGPSVYKLWAEQVSNLVRARF